MSATETEAPPTTGLVDDGTATTDSQLDDVVQEPDESTSRRRSIRVIEVLAGIVILAVVGVVIWLLLPDPQLQSPQSLRVEAVRSESVMLQWDAATDGPDAASYLILLGEDEMASVDAPATSIAVTGLTPNTSYEFVVVSVDGDRRSEPSDTIALTTDPVVPSALAIERVDESSVGLQWDATSDGSDPESYLIVHGDDELASVDAPATSVAVTGLMPNTRYDLAVVSVDGDRRSDVSEAVSVTTDPGTPTALRLGRRADTSVELQWDAPPGPDVDSFAILRGGEEMASVDAPDTSVGVTGLTPNTRYEFFVVSIAGGRRSEPSDIFTAVTAPAAPAELRIEDLGATSVRLVWDAPPGPGVDSYVILNEGDELGWVDPPETSFAIADLVPGAPYDFGVAARAAGRRSVPAWITLTAIAPSPGELSTDAAGNTIDTVTVTWSPPTGVAPPTEYIVTRDGRTVANVPGDQLSYTDTGLTPATAYEYHVAAHWGYESSEPTATIEVATAEPALADARLEGQWPVEVTMARDPGGNIDIGTTWTSTWTFEPSCDAGACDVSLSGNNTPPGFNYKGFTIDLVRDGAGYSGSSTAQITYCDIVPVENTVTVRLSLDTAAMQGGTWAANSWTGTLEISSPYTDLGDSYCSRQTVREDLTATR